MLRKWNPRLIPMPISPASARKVRTLISQGSDLTAFWARSGFVIHDARCWRAADLASGRQRG